MEDPLKESVLSVSVYVLLSPQFRVTQYMAEGYSQYATTMDPVPVNISVLDGAPVLK